MPKSGIQNAVQAVIAEAGKHGSVAPHALMYAAAAQTKDLTDGEAMQVFADARKKLGLTRCSV